MLGSRDRILPDKVFGRNLGTEIARLGTHVAVAELEPGAGKGIGEIRRIGAESLGDGPIDRVHLERHVGRRHHRRHPAIGAVGTRRQRFRRVADRLPLIGACGALHQLVFMIEQHVEIGHVPGDRRRRPGALDARGDGVVAHAAFMGRQPAKALGGDIGAFGFDPDERCITGAVRLAERMSAGGERDCLLVVHAHAGKGLAHVTARTERVGAAAGAFGIDIDQAHLDRGERIFERAAGFLLDAGGAEPLLLGAPVDVLFRLEDVLPAAAEAEHRPTHRFNGDIARQDHQIRP